MKMTALDAAIKATMDKYSVTLFPCIFQPDGKLLVTEIETQYNCIVETYIEEEPLDNGNVRISSGFYVFSAIDKKVVIKQLATAEVNKCSGDQIPSTPFGKGKGVATSMIVESSGEDILPCLSLVHEISTLYK